MKLKFLTNSLIIGLIACNLAHASITNENVPDEPNILSFNSLNSVNPTLFKIGTKLRKLVKQSIKGEEITNWDRFKALSPDEAAATFKPLVTSIYHFESLPAEERKKYGNLFDKLASNEKILECDRINLSVQSAQSTFGLFFTIPFENEDYFLPRKEEILNLFFSDQVFSGTEQLKLTSQEGLDQFFKTFFSGQFFGDSEKGAIKIIDSQGWRWLREKCGYTDGHLISMIMHNSPGREGTLEKAKIRWNPIVQLQQPDFVRKAFMATKNAILQNIEAEEVAYDFYLRCFAEGRNLKINHPNTKKSFDEFMDDLFSYKNFGIPENPEDKREHFQTLSNISFLSPKLIRAIFDASQKIMQLSQPGDMLVCFGNSPYYVGRALHHLVSDNSHDPNYRNIVIFPFSGTPNKMRAGSLPTMKNIVTLERLEHLRNRMQATGLSSDNSDLLNHNTFFIDVVGSGGGPAYVIEEIVRDCKANKRSLPNISLVTMNQIDISDEDDTRNAMIAKHQSDEQGHNTLYFPSVQNPHFAIDAYEAYIEGHSLLDNLTYNEMRVLPEYNACYWHPNYDGLLKDDYFDRENFPYHIQMMFDYFDFHVANLIEQ